jgi:hypothetical protein
MYDRFTEKCNVSLPYLTGSPFACRGIRYQLIDLMDEWFQIRFFLHLEKQEETG